MYQLKKRVVISGHPGTGTTTLIDKLGILYDLKPEQKVKVGDLFRQNSREKTGHDITGFYQREISEDLSIDQMQKQLLLDPNPYVLFILESRLGGFFVNQIRQQAKDSATLPPPIVTVLITTDEQVRLKRVFERDHPNVSFDEYSSQIKKRQQQDLKQWQEAYPQMTSNPLDNPDLYDFHIDNTNLDIDQTVEAVNKKLIELGAVEEFKIKP